MTIITTLPLSYSNLSLSDLNRRLSNPVVTPAVNLHHISRRPCYFRAAAVSDGAAMILHDAGATVAVMTGAYALVATFDNLTQRNIIQQVCIKYILM